MEDEQHFLISDIRRKYAAMFQHAFTAQDLITQSEPTVFGGFLRECFPVGKLCYLSGLLVFQPFCLFGPDVPKLA